MSRLLVLDGKNFQSGISTLGAHSTSSGIFYKAAGVTPLFDAGSAQSANNGLLLAGAAPTAAGYGTVTGNIMNSIPHDASVIANCHIIVSTSTGKVARLELSSGVPNGNLTTIFTAGTTLTPGLQFATLADGKSYIFYRQLSQIGNYETGVPTQTDAWQATTSDYFGTFHYHYGLGKYIFGNGAGKLGTLTLAGTLASSTFNLAALTFESTSICSALSDDGVYVIAALARNQTADSYSMVGSRIIFWDGSATTGFIRDYPVSDPLIYDIQKTPMGVFAFGMTGIWQVSLNGVDKIFPHNPGVYTASGSAVHYGRCGSFFAKSLLWGGQVGSSTTRAIKSFGKLDSSSSNAYLHPILGTASKNITHVNAQLTKGYIYWADDTPALNYAPIGSGTPWTGASAQTVYFPVAQPVSISHIDVIFGEPLASGDTLDLDVFRDEDTAATDYGSVSYSPNQTIRRHSFFMNGAARVNANMEIHNQLSLLLTFTAGAVKIKRIEVYGDPLPV